MRCCWPPDSAARIAVALVGQVDQLEQLVTLRLILSWRVPDLEAEADVVADGHVREQRVRLEHHPDVSLVRCGVRDVSTVDDDRADVGRSKRRSSDVVVLPQPDGPRNETNSPRSASSWKFSTAATCDCCGVGQLQEAIGPSCSLRDGGSSGAGDLDPAARSTSSVAIRTIANHVRPKLISETAAGW
jgi:hypothetical protein